MKQSTKRLASFVGSLLLIFAAIVVFTNFVRPAYRDAQSAKSEVLAREELLENQRAAVEQVRGLIEAYEGEGDFVQVISLVLPQEGGQAEIIHQIGRLAAANQLIMQSISVDDQGGGGARGASSLVRPLGALNIKMRLAGRYENFKTFLENIETNIRIMDVESVGVSPLGGANENFYLFDMAIAAYYQGDN